MSNNTLQSNPSLSSNRDLKDFNPLKHFSQDNYKNNYPGCNDFLTEDSPHLYQVTKIELTSTLDNLRCRSSFLSVNFENFFEPLKLVAMSKFSGFGRFSSAQNLISIAGKLQSL